MRGFINVMKVNKNIFANPVIWLTSGFLGEYLIIFAFQIYYWSRSSTDRIEVS